MTTKYKQKLDEAIMECYTRLYAAATPSVKFLDLPIYDKSSKFYLDYEISKEEFELIVAGIFKEFKIKKMDRAPFRITILFGCSPKFKKDDTIQ